MSNESDYDFLLNTVDECIRKVAIQDIISHKLLIFGSNMTQKLACFLENCRRYSDEFSYVYVGQEKQLEKIEDSLGKKVELIPWNAQYDKTMIEILNDRKIFDSCSGSLFVGSAQRNLRDINIIEIQALLYRNFDWKCYMYNYNSEELYEYKDIECYLAGIKAFLKMNDFFMTLG